MMSSLFDIEWMDLEYRDKRYNISKPSKRPVSLIETSKDEMNDGVVRLFDCTVNIHDSSVDYYSSDVSTEIEDHNECLFLRSINCDIWDSHSHLQMESVFSIRSLLLERALLKRVNHIVICGVSPGRDWDNLTSIKNVSLSFNGARSVSKSQSDEINSFTSIDKISSNSHSTTVPITAQSSSRYLHNSLPSNNKSLEWHYPVVYAQYGLHPWWIEKYFLHSEIGSSVIQPQSPLCNKQKHSKSHVNISIPFQRHLRKFEIDLCSAVRDANESNMQYFLSENNMHRREALERKAKYIQGNKTVASQDLLYPIAGIGECGLDKFILSSVPFEYQTEVLIAHMRVAYQFKLPLTLHIVQMYHHLIDLLTHNRIFLRYFTGIPAIIFHFCNYIPHDVLSTLLAYENCFFSVNGKIIDDINKEFTFNNSKESIKTANHKNANCADNVGSGNNISANKKLNSRHDNAISLLRTIPIDHLLIESDSPDQLPSNIYGLAKKASNGVCNTTTTKERTSALESKNESIQPTFKTKYFNEPSLVYYTYQCIAGVLDVSLQHLAAQLHNNNLRIWWATKQ